MLKKVLKEVLKRVNLTQKSAQKSKFNSEKYSKKYSKKCSKRKCSKKIGLLKKVDSFFAKNLKFVVNKKTDLSPHPPITESEFYQFSFLQKKILAKCFII